MLRDAGVGGGEVLSDEFWWLRRIEEGLTEFRSGSEEELFSFCGYFFHFSNLMFQSKCGTRMVEA